MKSSETPTLDMRRWYGGRMRPYKHKSHQRAGARIADINLVEGEPGLERAREGVGRRHRAARARPDEPDVERHT